ncbi:MAG: succinate dehydrogenase, hydrophobic membrane anchor protein [Ignavibacteriales bacterium]|nr:succinate dehydrogenase, hydrophobic membrane anchor protein [Ignavibacteriales bacterium]
MGYLTRNTSHSFGWFMQRISAIFLAAGLLIHFWVLHFTIERPVTFEKVQSRLHSPMWIVFDILLLAAAIYHALNGAWNITLDYNPSASFKKVFGWFLFFIGVALVGIGVYIIIPFSIVGGVQ